jgi:hypothetical protein
MAARPGRRPNGCMRDLSDNPRTPGDNNPDSSADPLIATTASSPAIIRRHSSASSSFVLGSAASGSTCGRSNWTPPTRRRQPASHRGSRHTSHPRARHSQNAGPRQCALLTRPALMGAGLRLGFDGLAHSYGRRLVNGRVGSHPVPGVGKGGRRTWLGPVGGGARVRCVWRRTVETHIRGLVTCRTGCSSGTGRGLSFERHRGGGS